MIEGNIEILFTFVVYFLFMMGIGWIFYHRTENLSDYILGGRGLNTYVTSLSAQASDMSGWLLLGLPGLAYETGLGSLWIAIGLAIGTYMNWKCVAKRLRQFTQVAGDSITLPDYFENRFHDKTKTLRILSALFILIFFLIYTSSGFVAGAKLFHSVFGLSYTWALSIGVFVIIAYTFLGGFMAVSWTDFFQGTLMFFAILSVPLIVIYLLGGVNSTIMLLENENPALLSLVTELDGQSLSWISIISLLAWGLGYFGQPHILARFMAIRSSAQIKQARLIAMIWVVISLLGAVVIGMVGIVYLKTQLTGAATETVFMELVNAVFHPLLAGILLAAILAAVMSTADSQLLVTSSAIAEDFYKVLFRRNASDKELVWIGRGSVILVALVAFIIALDPESSVLNLVAYAWGGFGATFGPLIILSLFWKRMTRNGALTGMVVGGLTVLIWKQLSGGIFELYEIVPGFVLSLICIVVVSLLDRKPEQAVLLEYDKVGQSGV
ncbi:MAG TPA: sodium/proline symporter PutP [bacterium]|nr:sodium/proline symporter PutP [bacterium]